MMRQSGTEKSVQATRVAFQEQREDFSAQPQWIQAVRRRPTIYPECIGNKAFSPFIGIRDAQEAVTYHGWEEKHDRK